MTKENLQQFLIEIQWSRDKFVSAIKLASLTPETETIALEALSKINQLEIVVLKENKE